MTKKLKQPLAFLSAFVMIMALLLYFPSGTFSNIDWGIKASAVEMTQPAGDGTSGSPYQIGTAAELYWFAACVNGTDGVTQNKSANAVLTADIVVNTGGVANCNGTKQNGWVDWTPIGNSYSNSSTGNFDGQGHTVSGLYFNNTATDNVGLFGYVGTGGIVSNVGVVDSYFNGSWEVGGVCGNNSAGTITNCYNAGTVSGSGDIGGVCGNNYGPVTDCYNTGAVSGEENVGGVCGWNGENGKITNCYSVVAVRGSSCVGGVCGVNEEGTITNCYYNIDVYNGDAVGEDNNGTIGANVLGKSTAEFSSGVVCSADTGVGYHSYQNGICALCGDYEPAVRTTDKYDINGDNTNDEVYEISNAGQLYWFAAQVNGGSASLNAVLTANITVNSNLLSSLNSNGTVPEGTNVKSWTSIGNGSNNFTGTFNGQNHTVSGLYFRSTTEGAYVGLFGYVGTGGIISNVGVVDSYFNEYRIVGGVCGENEGTITNCYYTGTITGSYFVGGVCGADYGTIIENCYNEGTVIGSNFVGGICGDSGGTITKCYNTGTVTGGKDVGGVCGNADCIITNCYNTGTVSGEENVGGLYGECNDNDYKNCYNTGTVSGKRAVGGVCGYNFNNCSDFSTCYFLDNISLGVGAGTDLAVRKNQNQFASGEVAYLLQGEQTEAVWGQNLADTGKQDYPVLGGTKVFQNKTYAGCADNPGDVIYVYANETAEPVYEPHALTSTPENKPTCTETGNKAYWTCSKCNKIFSKEDGTETFESIEATVIPATGHNLQKVEAKAATCTEAGNEEYWTCSTCSKMFSDKNGTDEIAAVPVIEKTGHSFTEEKVKEQALKDAATCTSKAVYYKSCSKCDAISKNENDVFESGEALPHDYSESGVCKNCDALKNGNDGFKSASVTLTDGVILNYYVLLSEEAKADTNAYIHFTSDKGLDKTIKLSEGVLDNGRYKFSLELRPDQMAEEITAKVVYSDNSEGSSVTYSVKQYAESVNEADSSKNLANAMLRFGAYTQLYLDKDEADLATSVEDYTENASIADTYNYQLDSNASGITVNAATLQIGAYTTIRVKYQLDEGADITKYTFKCDNAAVEAEQNGNYCYVYFRNIRPENLGDMHSFTVSDGTNTTTFEYSAFSYMKNVLDNANYQDKKIVNLINAMYDYYEAATEYMDNNSN